MLEVFQNRWLTKSLFVVWLLLGLSCGESSDGSPTDAGPPIISTDSGIIQKACPSIFFVCEWDEFNDTTIVSTAFQDRIVTNVFKLDKEFVRFTWLQTPNGLEITMEHPTLGVYDSIIVQQPSLPDLKMANAFGLSIAQLNETSGNTNKAGCDNIGVFQIENKTINQTFGSCCDQHDICTSQTCVAENSTSSIYCNQQAKEFERCQQTQSQNVCLFQHPQCNSRCITSCHQTLHRCIAQRVFDKKASTCIQREDCEETEQCIINGEIETNACVCAENGQTPVDNCQNQTDAGINDSSIPDIGNLDAGIDDLGLLDAAQPDAESVDVADIGVVLDAESVDVADIGVVLDAGIEDVADLGTPPEDADITDTQTSNATDLGILLDADINDTSIADASNTPPDASAIDIDASLSDDAGIIDQGDASISDTDIVNPSDAGNNDAGNQCSSPNNICVPNGVFNLTINTNGIENCQFTVSVFWGDGTSDTRTIINTSTVLTHTYEPGIYRVVAAGTAVPLQDGGTCNVNPAAFIVEVPPAPQQAIFQSRLIFPATETQQQSDIIFLGSANL